MKNYKIWIAVFALLAITVYFFAELLKINAWANVLLYTVGVVATIPLVIDIAKSLLNKHFGVDLLAIVSITGSLLLGQPLAAVIIVLMLSGGEALENYASHRSRADLAALIETMPAVASKKIGTQFSEVAVEQLRAGDHIIVRKGEMAAVDGVVIEGESYFDEANITGEPAAVRKQVGDQVLSGTICNETPVVLIVEVEPKNSTYQKLVALVRGAEENKAPLVRMADSYSVWFTAVAFVIAAAAYAVSGEPVRALAVLVVATPCPLILAAPISFVAGISKGANIGVIFKSGGALEKLARVNAIAFDKTGTLTKGKLRVVKAQSLGGTSAKRLLDIALSLEKFSLHPIARAIAMYAQQNRGDVLPVNDFAEHLGSGVAGKVDGVQYHLGGLKYMQQLQVDTTTLPQSQAPAGGLLVVLASNNIVQGYFELQDQERQNVAPMLKKLGDIGVKYLTMLTGDKQSAAAQLAAKHKLSHYIAECKPHEKLAEIERLQTKGYFVAMVGDGVNDAPALATANVGIAMGLTGGNASTDTSDIVITLPKIERVAESMHLAKAVVANAKQSILVGIGLSIGLMLIAATGAITPVYGALLQEFVDVAVIVNSLRVTLFNPVLFNKQL